MVDLTKAYHKALDEEEGMTKEQLAIKNVGKQVRKVKEYLNHYCNVRMYSTDRYPCPLWVGVGVCGWVCMCACLHVCVCLHFSPCVCFLIIHHNSNNSEACWAVCWVWVPAFLHSGSNSKVCAVNFHYCSPVPH